MSKHEAPEQFKPPSWAWDNDSVPPYDPLSCAGYVDKTGCFYKAFAVIFGLPVYLGAYISKHHACRAIAAAHRGDST